MGIDIGGATIVKTAGITINTSLVFNAAGQGRANDQLPGYAGWKSGGSTYYSATTGWEVNLANWKAGLNLSNGVFTCPVAGIYAMGFNGILNGGSGNPAGYDTFSYYGFAKNGVANGCYGHCNKTLTNGWNTGGQSALFQCAAGDTLALFVNRPPVSAGPSAIAQNTGMYPDAHHAVWCRLVG